MNKHFFIFREPESIDELKSLLLLRYSVYRQSRLHNYVTENDAGIDLDGYDLSSLHFGLFEHEGNTSRPVGYMRVVTRDRSPFHGEILEIAGLVPRLAKRVSVVPGEPLPIFDCNPYEHLLRTFYEATSGAGEKVVEPSRLSLDRSVRGREISRFMVSAVFGALMVEGVNHALTLSHAAHREFYKQFGFEALEGTTDFQFEKYDVHDVILHGMPEQLPAVMKDRVLSMAESYFNTGRICYYPDAPSQVYAPRSSNVPIRHVLTAA